jgi:hypothetical protein
MPGGRLLRGVARTAVVAGTATATSNAVNRRMARKNVEAYGDAQNQYQEETQQQAPPVAVGAGPSPGTVVQQPAPGGEEDTIAQLERLAQLKAQGILTDEEFAAEKAKILG